MRFNFVLNIALISIAYILYKSRGSISRIYSIIYLLFGALIMCILLLSEGRSGFLASLFIVSFFSVAYIYKYYKKFLIVVFALLIPLLYVGIKHQHRLTSDFLQREPRLFLWKISIPIIKDDLFLGKGASTAEFELTKVRLEKQDAGQTYLWSTNKLVDSHNQFIQTTLEFGLIGLLLLLFVYLYPLKMVTKERFVFLSAFLLICFWQSMFDIFITGQFGIIFAFVLCLIMHTKDSDMHFAFERKNRLYTEK